MGHAFAPFGLLMLLLLRCSPMLRSSMATGNASASGNERAVAAAAAVVAAVGVPGITRNDEAITGAAGAPVVTSMVENSQLMPTLTQSGAAATAIECSCADSAMD